MVTNSVSTGRTMLLAAVLLAAAFAAPSRPLAAQDRPCKTCEDSSSEVRLRVYRAEIDRLRVLVEAMRNQRDPQMAQALRATDSALRQMDPQRKQTALQLDRVESLLRERAGDRLLVDPNMRHLVLGLDSLQKRMKFQFSFMPPVPPGYMGVNYSGEAMWEERTDEAVVHHFEYPVVESVEIESPAARAGIVAGDTILAYNGRDIRERSISLTRMLQPGSIVRVRLRNRGRVREAVVTVARRPAALAQPVVVVDAEPYVYMTAPSVPLPPRTPRPGRAPQPPRAPVEPAEPLIALDPIGPVLATSDGATIMVIAGAQVSRLNEGLREYFGSSEGVLVVNVARGSPAERAGLRGGDLIVRCAGDAVTSPASFQRAVRRAATGETRSLPLVVLRKNATRELTLKW